jgi:drug/metabolite transporter (DMT)-like permease
VRSDLTLGGLLVALSALGYATNPIFAKIGYMYGATPITLMAIRFVVASLGLWLAILWRGNGGGLSVRQRLQLVGMGVFGFAVVSLLYFTAVQSINASLATGLFYTYPALVAVVGFVRGEGISKWGWMGLMLTAAGTWMLLGRLGGFTWQGVVLILSSCSLYTAYILVGERWTRDIPPEVATAHVTSGSAAVFLVLSFLTHQSAPSPGAYLAGTGLAACSTVLALITFFAGMARVGPTRASIISTLEPGFTVLMAAVLLGERLALLQTLGIVVVVTGAVLAQQRDQATVGTVRQV